MRLRNEEPPMPQKEMRIIQKPAGDAIVLEPETGKLALEGNGDTTYRCGACKTRLMDNVSHMDVFHGEPFDAVKCPKCGKYNQVPEEDHHHHH
jgi:ssDNA-binding Zn-finger/Zn-ribbon topoisomerase 1